MNWSHKHTKYAKIVSEPDDILKCFSGSWILRSQFFSSIIKVAFPICLKPRPGPFLSFCRDWLLSGHCPVWNLNTFRQTFLQCLFGQSCSYYRKCTIGWKAIADSWMKLQFVLWYFFFCEFSNFGRFFIDIFVLKVLLILAVLD